MIVVHPNNENSLEESIISIISLFKFLCFIQNINKFYIKIIFLYKKLNYFFIVKKNKLQIFLKDLKKE